MRRGRGWLAAGLVVMLVLVGMILSLALVGRLARGEPFAIADLLRPPYLPVLDLIGAASTAVAGALLGGLAAVLVLRRIRGGFDCPVCGTTNAREAVECVACGERFRETAGPVVLPEQPRSR